MKVLAVHNHYGSGSPSGESVVFRAEQNSLLQRGHDVRTIERHSDEIRRAGWRGLVQGALCTPWSLASARQVGKAVRNFRPDVVHAHNIFPLLSASIFSASRGAARVLTLHNYRLFCSAGIPMRGGAPCTMCLDRRSVVPALRHGCYRGSRVATLPLAVSIALHRRRRTWHRDVDAFIALTEYQRDLMIAAGLPQERVEVKPNHFSGDAKPHAWASRPRRICFVGRLGPEKGVQDLVEACEHLGRDGPQVQIVGCGPLLDALRARVGALGLSQVHFTGQVSPNRARSLIASSRLLVLPSRWFEGFPMVLAEAFALGTPVVVSNLGPLPGLVVGGVGAVAPPGSALQLAAVIRRLWADQEGLSRMGEAARLAYERLYTEETSYQRLMCIYERAMCRAAGRRRCA